MARTAAELTLERETRARYGAVPHRLFDQPLEPMSWQMRDSCFLLRADVDHYFYYRQGEGVTIHRGIGTDAGDESLWLNGSVYAAIACMNGFLPIHASAVAFDGQVFAFTGPAGAGKSTLAAALGRYGLPLFCDDTLILDMSDPTTLTCLPGHKRLKLCPDAFALAGAVREERVSQGYDKYYATPAAGTVETAMPLATLMFLEEGPDMAISPISGKERFLRVADDHQAFRLFEAANTLGPAELFAQRASLAKRIAMSRFVRPMDGAKTDAGIAMVANHIRTHGGSRP